MAKFNPTGVAVAFAALASAGAIALTACSTASPQAPSVNASPVITAQPASPSLPSVSCLTVLAQLHAVIGSQWADSGPNDGPADASQAVGSLPDGTELDCYAGYGPAPQTGNDVVAQGFHLFVIGGTSPSVIASEVGGAVK